LIPFEANFVKVKQLNKMRVLVVDFYDSFVFNLVHYFETLGCEVLVLTDYDFNLSALDNLGGFNGVVLSPGPGLPHETHSMQTIINYCRGKIPVFGVCLGMQGLGLDLGGTLFNLHSIRHGMTTNVHIQSHERLFNGFPKQIEVGLYHSWALKEIPVSCVIAFDEEGVVMAIENTETKQYGVQFHPESIMTSFGMEIVKNVISEIFN